MKIQNLPSPIFQKPLKKLPSELIIPLQVEKKSWFTGKKYTEYIYKMVDTFSKQEIACMSARPMRYISPFQSYYPIRKPYKSFYIEYLESKFSGFGYGTALINIAKQESKRLGCDGRVNLIASRVFDPKRPPHIFYRKCGFTSNDSLMNFIMDETIFKGDKVEEFLYDNLKLYLPEKKNSKSTKLPKILKYISDMRIKLFKKISSLGKKNPD